MQQVATQVDVSRPMVWRWQQRFAEEGPDGLLNVPEGTVIGRCMQRHRHQAFIRFLSAIERTVPAGKIIEAILTRQRIRRGSFPSIVSLQAAINRYLDHRNAEPPSFVWTASVASILAKLARLPVASE